VTRGATIHSSRCHLDRPGARCPIFLMSATFVPFLAYFMLTWKDHVRKSTVELFDPSHRKAAYATLGEISAMIKSFLAGNALIGGVFSRAAGSLIFKLIGLPYFFIVGSLSGILSLVPYFGVLLAVCAAADRRNRPDPSRPGVAAICGTVLGLHLDGVSRCCTRSCWASVSR